jgi:hypothetical protein
MKSPVCSFTDKFFLDASTMNTIDTGLKNIATVKNAGNSSKQALQWLASAQEEWLVVFDNADDPKLNMNSFLPRCSHGNIIITSRNPELHGYGGSHSLVSDMEENDAVGLLLKSSQQEISPTNKGIGAEIVRVRVYYGHLYAQISCSVLRSSAIYLWQLFKQEHLF